MPDTKVAGLNAITEINTALDFIPIVDVSDPQMAISGTTKKITISQILSAGTNLVIPAGTAGAPSISFSGDSNTGIYAPAADQLAISAGGSGKATVTATGLDITGNATVSGNLTVDTNTLVVDAANNRLGIGTATPDSLLHLEYPSTCNWKLRNSGSGVHIASYAGSSLGTIGTISNNDFYLFTNNTERIRLASDGVCTWSNVGGVVSNAMVLNGTGLSIGGSIFSNSKLTLVSAAGVDCMLALQKTGGSNTSVMMTDGTNAWLGSSSGSTGKKLIYALAAPDNSVVIDSTGNVGIAATTPAASLQVGARSSSAAANNSTIFTAGGASASAGTTVAATFANTVAAAVGNEAQITFTPASNYSATGAIGTAITSTANGESALKFYTYHSSVTGLTERLRIASDGVCTWSNVGGNSGTAMTLNGTGLGIGITPNYPLQVFRAGGAGSLGISIDNVGTTDRVVQYFSIQGAATTNIGTGHAFYYRTPSSTTDSLGLILSENGDVGIGTATPQSKLSVETSGIQSTISPVITAQSTGTTYAGMYSVRDGAGDQRGLVWQVYTANVGLGEKMRLDSSGNLGLGVTPSAWQTNWKVLQFANGSSIGNPFNGAGTFVASNTYRNASGDYVRLDADSAALYVQLTGSHRWHVAGSSTAGSTIPSFSTGSHAMILDSSGNLAIGKATASYKLEVVGATDTAGISLTTAYGVDAEKYAALRFTNSSFSGGHSEIRNVVNGSASLGSSLTFLTAVAETGNLAERLRITSGGNVGINETVPTAKLHVKGTGVNIVSIVDSSATGYSGLTFKGTGTQAYAIGVGGPSETAFSAANSFYIYDGLAGTMRLRIDPVGNFLLTSKTISVGNLWPKYSVFFGGAQDLNWKKIADITFGTSLYSGATLRVEVTDANTNFGGNAGCIPLTYFVCCIRSGAVLNDTDTAVVTGPVAEYVRVVKTALGVFELQVRQPNDWKHMTFTAQAISVGGGAQTVINYVNGVPQNGSTTGTIYTATAGWTQSFPNVSVSGNLTSGYGTFAAPAYVVGDSQYGIYANSGILYYKNSSAGAHYWRNTTNTANLMSLDASGNFLVGPGGAQYTAANRGNITVAGTGEALFGLSVNNTPSGYLWGTTTNVEIGAPAGRYITFSINGEKVRVQNDGNVGIGTGAAGTQAIGRLHVDVTSASACSAILAKMGGGDPDFKLVARNGFGAAGNSESARFGLEYQPASSSGTWNSGFRFLRGGGASDGYMVACTSGQDRVWFDVAGNLGIGVAPSGQGGAGHLHMPNSAAILGRGKALSFITNGYFDTQWRVYADGNFTQYYANDGIHYWYNGTGTVASGFSSGPNLAMSLDMSNNLFVAGSLTTGYAVRATAAGQPVVSLNRSGNGLNEKYVEWTMYDSTFRGRIVNDAYSAASDFMTVARSGITVTNITFPGSAVTVSGTLNAANGTAAAPSITFTSDTNTGIYRPGTDIVALATNGTERLRADASGNVVVNTAAVATNATSGFLWIPSCAGTPTGAPTAPYTNAAAMVWDRTNKKLYVYDGSWNEALPPV